MWVERRYLDRRGMTLWSLKTYEYIGSKTKSYQILRGFLLLSIFHAFWPYKASLPCFLTFWPYKVGLLCFFAFWLYKTGLPCFLIYFSFCWELLGLCSRADRIPTIIRIITECLAIHLTTSDFFCSDRINYLTRSIHKTLWRRQHSTVLYLLHLVRRAITHQTFLVPN